jgi:hypothetical protein
MPSLPAGDYGFVENCSVPNVAGRSIIYPLLEIPVDLPPVQGGATGPQGPPGAAGAQGPPGPTGATGATGQDGICVGLGTVEITEEQINCENGYLAVYQRVHRVSLVNGNLVGQTGQWVLNRYVGCCDCLFPSLSSSGMSHGECVPRGALFGTLQIESGEVDPLVFDITFLYISVLDVYISEAFTCDGITVLLMRIAFCDEDGTWRWWLYGSGDTIPEVCDWYYLDFPISILEIPLDAYCGTTTDVGLVTLTLPCHPCDYIPCGDSSSSSLSMPGNWPPPVPIECTVAGVGIPSVLPVKTTICGIESTFFLYYDTTTFPGGGAIGWYLVGLPGYPGYPVDPYAGVWLAGNATDGGISLTFCYFFCCEDPDRIIVWFHINFWNPGSDPQSGTGLIAAIAEPIVWGGSDVFELCSGEPYPTVGPGHVSFVQDPGEPFHLTWTFNLLPEVGGSPPSDYTTLLTTILGCPNNNPLVTVEFGGTIEL